MARPRARALATQGAIERVEANADAQRKLIVAQVQGHEGRLLQIEERVAHLPGHTDLGAIYERLGATDSRLAEVSAEVKATNHLLAVVHNHLLERALK